MIGRCEKIGFSKIARKLKGKVKKSEKS